MINKRFLAGSIALMSVMLLLFFVACSDQASIVGPEGAAQTAPEVVAQVNGGELHTVYWQGHGSEHIDGCTTGYHWIAAPAGGIMSVPQFFSSIPADNDVPMFRPSGNNDPGTAAWHYNSGLVTTTVGVTPYITFLGDPSQVKLIISHCLDEDGQSLAVTKTADTEFMREHDWRIIKRVRTENEYMLDGVPKIWLYADGSGDETARWRINVRYEGFEDSDFVIYGDIFITNISDPPVTKTITSIVDNLGLTGYEDVLVGCEDGDGAAFTNAALPRDIEPGETWVCAYRVELPDGVAQQGDSGMNTVTVAVQDDPFSPYVGMDPWEFGDPEEELYATINVNDLSDLFGEQNFGPLNAADFSPGGSANFTYNKPFAYAEYGPDDCGSFQYDNTATIVETGEYDEASLKVNVQCYVWESAWAMGVGEGVEAKPFCENGFSNWGWSNLIGQPYGPAEWPLYAGAGQCDASKGTVVGHFELTYNGGFVYEFVPSVAMNILFEGEAVYAGSGMFPLLPNGKPTTAPGAYTVASLLSGDIYVIAHVNAGMPDPTFGPTL